MPSEVPSIDELEQLVRDALHARGQDAVERERAVLIRVTCGVLRLMDDPTGGLPAMLGAALFGGASAPAQAAQWVVDYWLAGVRDIPPYPQRPQMPPIMASAFEVLSEPVPDDVELAVLVDVSIGLIQDRYPNGPVAAKQGVAQVVGRAYTRGA